MKNIDAAVSKQWRKDIQAKIEEIELEENARVLLAIESGSRAWGFHSPDSDYDVRFIYSRPTSWHLSLHKKRDVIERPIDGDWDLSGWELAKSLKLAIGSNAVVAEWLQSPIVYKEAEGFREELIQFCKSALDRKSVTWHYLSLLKRQREGCYDDCGQVKLKRYFYVLRPVLALRWMRLRQLAMPPMNMQELIAGCDLSVDTQSSLEHLIERKKVIKEQGAIGKVDASLDNLIHEEETLSKEWLLTNETHFEKVDLFDAATNINIKYSDW